QELGKVFPEKETFKEETKNTKTDAKNLFATEKLQSLNTLPTNESINNDKQTQQIPSKSDKKDIHPTNPSNPKNVQHEIAPKENFNNTITTSTTPLENITKYGDKHIDQSEKSIKSTAITQQVQSTSKTIDWVKYFQEHKSPKSLKYKPSQRKLWTSGKAAQIMQYYCENKDKKKLLTMSRELKKMYNFSCTFNTISHFILFILDQTKNLSNFDKKPEEEDSSDAEDSAEDLERKLFYMID